MVISFEKADPPIRYNDMWAVKDKRGFLRQWFSSVERICN